MAPTGTGENGTASLAPPLDDVDDAQSSRGGTDFGVTETLSPALQPLSSSLPANGQQHHQSSAGDGPPNQDSVPEQEKKANPGILTPATTAWSSQALGLHSPASAAADTEPKLRNGSIYSQLIADHAAASGAARSLSEALRSTAHIGVQTEAFGRVTIQASSAGGQLLAQLSVENAHQGAALAAHLPALEQKLSEQSSLPASVKLVSTAGSTLSDAGDQRGEPSQQHHRSLPGTDTGKRVSLGRSQISEAMDSGLVPAANVHGAGASWGRMRVDIMV